MSSTLYASKQNMVRALLGALILFPIVLIAASTSGRALGFTLATYGGLLLFVYGVAYLIARILFLQELKRTIDREKDEFLSFASHQLRTPLTTMRWRIEMLLAGDAGALTRTQRTYLEKVEESNRHMATLVSHFLNVSRINLGTLAIKPEACDVHALIENILEELSPLIPTRGVRIKKEFDKTLPDRLMCDPRIIRMLIFNLLANAICYTTRGMVTIGTKKSGAALHITVSDTGPGISEDEQKNLFTKPFHTRMKPNTRSGGSGLGLYIVKRLVDLIDGSILVSSQLGRGSTFTLSLPIMGMRARQGTRTVTRTSLLPMGATGSMKI